MTQFEHFDVSDRTGANVDRLSDESSPICADLINQRYLRYQRYPRTIH